MADLQTDAQTGLQSGSQTGAAKTELSHEFARYTRALHVLKDQLAHLLPAGLDPAAASLLSWLVRQGPSRQAELAESTLLDPSTVSRRISQLVQQGLVERRADPVDGRAAQLVPTASGTEFFRLFQVRREEIMSQVLSDWSSDDLTALTALLRKFNDDFETYRFGLHSPAAAQIPTTNVPPSS